MVFGNGEKELEVDYLKDTFGQRVFLQGHELEGPGRSIPSLEDSQKPFRVTR